MKSSYPAIKDNDFQFRIQYRCCDCNLGCSVQNPAPPGGSLLLSIGMGTEVLMFILSAFDTPPKTYHWEEVFPVLNSKNPEDRPEFSGGKGTVIIGGNGKGGGSNGGNYSDITPSDAKRAVGIPEGLNLSDADTQSLTDSIQKCQLPPINSRVWQN